MTYSEWLAEQLRWAAILDEWNEHYEKIIKENEGVKPRTR